MSRLLRLAKIVSVLHNNKWLQKDLKEWSEYLNIPVPLILSWGNNQEKYLKKLCEHNVFEDPIEIYGIILFPLAWKKQVPKYKEFVADLIEGKNVIENIKRFLYEKHDANIRKLMNDDKIIFIKGSEISLSEISKLTNTPLKEICLLYCLGSTVPSTNTDKTRYVTKLCKNIAFSKEKNFHTLKIKFHGREYTFKELAEYIKNNSDIDLPIQTLAKKIKDRYGYNRKTYTGNMIDQKTEEFIDKIIQYNSLNTQHNYIYLNINGKQMLLDDIAEKIQYDRKTLIKRLREFKSQSRLSHPDWPEEKLYDESLKQLSEFCSKLLNEEYKSTGSQYFNINNIRCTLKDIANIIDVSYTLLAHKWTDMRKTLGNEQAYNEMKRLVEQEIKEPLSTSLTTSKQRLITYNGISKQIYEWAKEPQVLLYDPTGNKLKHHINKLNPSTWDDKVKIVLSVLDNIYHNKPEFGIIPISINGIYQYKYKTDWMQYLDISYVTLIDNVRGYSSDQEKIQYAVDLLNELISIDNRTGTVKNWLNFLHIRLSKILNKSIDEIKTFFIETIHNNQEKTH